MILILGFTSCKTDLNSYLINDDWVIQQITFNGENLKDWLTVNMLTFNENGECSVPIIYKDVEFRDNKDKIGHWTLIENNTKLVIKNRQEYFNDTLEICFNKDDNYRKVYMILKSDKLFIKAYRGLVTNDGYFDNLPIKCNEENFQIN